MRIAACHHKLGFHTRKQAVEKIAYLKRKHGACQEPYRCDYCEGWHIRSKPED